MGKASRNKHRELAEMASIAQDLDHLMQAPHLVQGFMCHQVVLRTHLGPTPGAHVMFKMQDGSEQGPFIMEPVTLIHLVTHLAGAISGIPVGNLPGNVPVGDGVPPAGTSSDGPQGVGNPVDNSVGGGPAGPGLPSVSGEVTLPSGLVLPG